MAPTDSSEEKTGTRIEGGIDAIVIGADADGLTAATYLGKAGLKTVLIDESAVLGGPIRTQRLANGVESVDGEHLTYLLDPEAIADLDLYRSGLSYASRRLDTAYFFDNGDMLHLDGDLQNAAALLDADDGAKDALSLFYKTPWRLHCYYARHLKRLAQIRTALWESNCKKRFPRLIPWG